MTKRPPSERQEHGDPPALEFDPPPEEVAQALHSQRDWMNRLAEAVENNAPLTRIDRMAIAALLRRQAERIPDALPRKPGKAPAFCHSTMALRFELAVRRGEGKDATVNRLAEEYDVSVEAIRKALRTDDRASAAKALLDSFGVEDNRKRNKNNKVSS